PGRRDLQRDLLRIKLRGEIPFTEVGKDDDDELAGVFGPAADLQGGPDGGAAADAAENAFLLRQAARLFGGVFVFDLHALVDDLHVQQVGDEAGAESLNRVPAGLELLAVHSLRNDGAVDRLDGDRLKARLTRFDDFADAGDGAAGADAGDEDI